MIMEFDIIKIKLDPHEIYDGKIIFLSFDGKPISPFEPIWWEEDNDNEKNGLHHQPAAFVINREKPNEISLIATIRIKGGRPGEKYMLNGYFTFEETITYEVNGFRSKNDFEIPGYGNEIKPFTMDVRVVSRYLPKDFAGLSTVFSWEITPANGGCNPGKQEENRKSTYLEFYWLYDAIDYSIFKYGVPLEILRYLALLSRTFFLYTQSVQDFLLWLILVTGQETPKLSPNTFLDPPKINDKYPVSQKKEIIEYIVKACFYRNPPRYDIYDSNNHYVSFNGDDATFYLAEYLNAIHDTNAVCNCFDQAFALNIFLSAVGIANVKCCYMEPFGYLRLTNLVGRGMCNNANWKDHRHFNIVEPNTGSHSIFVKHALCRRDEIWILDSCIGPHTGNEDYEDYVKNAVDHVYSPTYYTTRTPGEIKEINGSISLDYNLSIEELNPGLYRVDEFKEILDLDANIAEEEKKKEKYFVVCNWPNPGKCPVFGPEPNGWQVIFEKTTAGDQEVMKTWKLKKKGESVTIKIYVSRQSRYTFNRFLSLGSSSTLQELPYEPGPDYLGKRSAKSLHGDRGRHFWVPGNKKICLNVSFDVIDTNATFDVKELHKWLNHMAFTHKKINLDGYLPSMEDIIIYRQYEPGPVPGGGPPDGDSLSKDVGIDDGPIMIEKGKRLIFLTNTPGNIFLDFRYLKYETDEDKNGIGLRLIHKGDKSLEFIGFKESTNKLRLVAVNNDTLLCNSKNFTIQVKSD